MGQWLWGWGPTGPPGAAGQGTGCREVMDVLVGTIVTLWASRSLCGAMPRGSGPRGSVAPTAAARGSWLWGGLRTAGFGRGVMRFLSPRETAGEWSLVAELVKATSHAQSYCSPLVFSFADFCFYFRPAGGLMYPTACLFFLLIISVSLKKDITSLCKPCLHCSQQGR